MSTNQLAQQQRERSEHSALDAALREHFPLFLRKVFDEVSPGDKFCFGWYLDAIAFELDRIMRGDNQRLIVTIPPRHLKSITISIAWVAWCLGKEPSKRFICLSYNNELAAKLARDCRQVMQSDWYQRVFPATVLCRSTEMELETTAGGGRFATSVGGTLTGRGADVIIIDDPIKADDAMSAALRYQVRDWTTSTLFSRLNDKKTGAIILVMQRLHEDDLAGHFLDRGGWEHLNLPAVAQEEQVLQLIGDRVIERAPGDLLHEEREPQQVLDAIRRDLGPYAYSAQYLQAPVPAGGTMIQRDWLSRYKVTPQRKSGDVIVQSWDTASKDGPLNDCSACVTALVRDKLVYILNVCRRQLSFPDLLRVVDAQAEAYEPDLLLVEDAASGQQLLQVLDSSPLPHVPSAIPRKTGRR